MNVGTGVADFFYEPAKGAIQSPKAGPPSCARGQHMMMMMMLMMMMGACGRSFVRSL
jgi:hypothetical protein